LMGIVFFTVWSVIGYAMTGGKRDFTSMTATIPMQYELLVEHKHADQARRILAESGAAPAPVPVAPSTPLPGQGAPAGHAGGYGAAPGQGAANGMPAPAGPPSGRPSFGQSAPTPAPGPGAGEQQP